MSHFDRFSLRLAQLVKRTAVSAPNPRCLQEKKRRRPPQSPSRRPQVLRMSVHWMSFGRRVGGLHRIVAPSYNLFGIPPGPRLKRPKVSRENNIDDFKAQMRSKAKSQNELTDVQDDVRLGSGAANEWRERYYRLKFHLTQEDFQGWYIGSSDEASDERSDGSSHETRDGALDRRWFFQDGGSFCSLAGPICWKTGRTEGGGGDGLSRLCPL